MRSGIARRLHGRLLRFLFLFIMIRIMICWFDVSVFIAMLGCLSIYINGITEIFVVRLILRSSEALAHLFPFCSFTVVEFMNDIKAFHDL